MQEKIAQYGGTCVTCGDTIEADFDTVAYCEAEGAWVHAACWWEPDLMSKAKPAKASTKAPGAMTLTQRVKAGLA